MRARRFAGATSPRIRWAGLLGACAAAAGILLSGGPAAVAAPTGVAQVQTKASPSISLGGSLSDSAQAVGIPGVGGGGLGSVPTGTLTFDLYGPSDASCTASPLYSSGPVNLVIQGGVVATAASGSYTPTATDGSGTYHWIATYSGDSVYKPSAGSCGDASETVQVTDVTPKLTTVASPGVQAGAGQVTDTATLTGGKNATGTITFLLFPPNDPTCSGKIVDVKQTVPVSDPSSIVSQPYTPTAAGTYHWVALYSGDVHNGAVNGACGDPNETLVVTPAPAPPPGAGGSGGTGGAGIGPCDPVATAKGALLGIGATLTGVGAATFKDTCSAGVRIVLRAKEIRPGNKGTPSHNGYTTMANVLTHIAPGGPALNFSLNSAGQALRAYALSHNKSLVAFLIVHVRPDKTPTSTESLQILTLG
jgi:hypothetical protein